MKTVCFRLDIRMNNSNLQLVNLLHDYLTLGQTNGEWIIVENGKL